MASTLLSKTPLLNRLIHSSFSPSKKPQIFTSLFNKKLLHFQANPASVVHNPSRQLPRIMASSIAGARVHFSSQSLSTEDPVVSADWLHSNLKEPDLKVLDASWYMPDEQRNPIHEYQVAHIPGAIFFDIDGISDRTTKLPHMLPSEEAFAAVVSALGIENKDGVVVYDGKGIFSAARVWWMFRVFGHDRVWVLDGGLPKWRTLGYDVESSASGDAIFKATAASEAIERVYQGQYVGPITYQTEFQPHLVWNLDKVKENITERTHQHVDARSKARFDGDVPEPRKGIRSGHVPGSKCIPFAQEKWLHFQANPASVAYNSSRRLYLIMASSIVGARVRFSSNYLSAKDPVVSEDLLHSNPSENNLRFDGASSVPHNGIRSGHPAHHLPASIKWNEEGGEHANNLLLSLSNHPNPEVSCFSEKGFSQISKEIVGRTVHAICLKSLVGLSVFHTNTLINTYSKVGRINYARLVFDGMLKTNEASWNNMMSGYVRVCLYSEAMVFFQDICRLGIKPSGFVIASLVTACNKSSTMANEGFQLHGLAVKFGVIYDVFVGTSFVHFYGAYGIVSNAQKLFNEMPDRNVVSWTSLMVSYSDNGHKEEVINIYQRMRHEGIGCNENTIALVISSCGLLVDASLGLQLLGHATKFGLETKVSAANSLISMFGGCHNILEACNVFNQMNERDTISWNSIISANAQNGLYDESFRYFYWMRSAHEQINFTTLSILLSICGSVDYLKWGKGVHGLVVKYGLEFNICLCNTLLNMYSDSGRLEDAELIFGRMPEKDLISWNSMLACYARDGRCRCALKILAEMIWMKKEINYVTFTSALAACSDPEFLAEGIILHGLTIAMGLKDNLIIGNMLITLYGKSHKMVEAKKLFQRMPQRDKVTWNTLIGGYADNADLSEAVTAFNLMREGVRVDYITIINILSACLTPDDVLKHGMAIHAHTVVTGLEVDQHVESSLITMYAKCGDVQSSSCIFDKLLFKSSSVWNAIITANAHHGFGEEALKLVARMRNAGIEFDQFSFSIALSVAADLAMLEEGQQLHGSAIKLGFNFDHFIVNAAMDMYGKCGDLDDALRILPQPIHRSRLSWNTLISTFAKHGHFQEARETFHEMLKLGVKPDHVSFVCLLSACSHGGLVDEGLSYYASMTSEYGIQPGIEHCVCIIDLLGRSGRLVQAELFIREMPMPPNDLVWRSLLASCRIYHNLDLGRKAAERLLELDPSDDSAYVLYSNMFATSGKWKDVENMRRQMGAINIQKKPAHSWVKLKGNVSTFGMGDQTHSQTEQINAKLAGLKKMVGEAGYVPDTSCSLQDTDEEQKEHNMWNHSERIALAYGLINTPEGTTVRIFKNLRVCGDCHSFFKYVSGNLGRKIILRDPYRFHHFTHGNCSCSDYW